MAPRLTREWLLEFDRDGPRIGSVPLLEKRPGGYVLPSQPASERHLRDVLGQDFDISDLRDGLAGICAAMNEGDVAKAALMTGVLALLWHGPTTDAASTDRESGGDAFFARAREDASSAVRDYVEAVCRWGRALACGDDDVCAETVDRMRAITTRVEAEAGSLDLFLPLLDHQEEAVRCAVAAALIHRDRARCVAALRRLSETAPAAIGTFAAAYLTLIGEPSKRPDMP